jgi:3-oxoadipate enol-lactonase
LQDKADYAMPYFTTQDGCRLYYETHGAGALKPFVVFLNGTMQNTVNWKPQCDAFHDQFGILTYDARAQGQSDVGRQKLSLHGHATDLAALLDYLGIEQSHLIGMSHGAIVALALETKRPDQVTGLVLCSVEATPTCRGNLFVKSWLDILKKCGLEAMIWTALPVVLGERFLKQKERILHAVVSAMVTRNSKEGLQAHLEAIASYPPASQLATRVRVPTLVVSASEDPIVTIEGAKELAALCHGHHKHFSGIGHSVPVEAPELFNETVLAFLKKDGAKT